MMNRLFSRQRQARNSSVDRVGDDVMVLSKDTTLLDPVGNSPLKIYMASRFELPEIQNKKTRMPLRLSTHEKEVNGQGGTVLLLGRSGTGKTVCLCNRMTSDRITLRNGNDTKDKCISQLFVCRSFRLMESVKRYQQDYCYAGSGDNTNFSPADFFTIDKFIDRMDEIISKSQSPSVCQYHIAKRVEFAYFRDQLYPEILARKKYPMKFDAITVWTQIRSFIKGSIEAYLHASSLLDSFALSSGLARIASGWALPRSSYSSLSVIAKNRCNLTIEAREIVYSMFECYESLLAERGRWDDGDRLLDMLIRSQLNPTLNYNLSGEGSYDKVYVDEIQDSTQTEVLLYFLSSGLQYQSLFLAGEIEYLR
jgi:hypothetical protein